jgi:hypothetical protein
MTMLSRSNALSEVEKGEALDFPALETYAS